MDGVLEELKKKYNVAEEEYPKKINILKENIQVTREATEDILNQTDMLKKQLLELKKKHMMWRIAQDYARMKDIHSGNVINHFTINVFKD